MKKAVFCFCIPKLNRTQVQRIGVDLERAGAAAPVMAYGFLGRKKNVLPVWRQRK